MILKVMAKFDLLRKLIIGWEIIAWLKGLSVLLYAILLFQLNVQKAKLSVTWDQIVDAGKETTACVQIVRHGMYYVHLKKTIL